MTRRWPLLLLLVLLVPAWLGAQPVPQIVWEHDGLNLVSFQCKVDTLDPVTIYPSQTGNTYSAPVTDCPGLLTNGKHDLIIQACNTGGCTDATAITVVKL